MATMTEASTGASIKTNQVFCGIRTDKIRGRAFEHIRSMNNR